MKHGYDVVAIGAATRDIFLRSADFRVHPDPRSPTGMDECVTLGSKIDIARMVTATGGGASNAAATFAHLGLRAAFIGRIGKDEDGNAVLRDLREHGVDARYVRRDPEEPTAVSVLLSTYHHGRTVLVYRGASKELAPGDLPLRRIRTRWLYLSSLSGNRPLLQTIMRGAHRSETPVFLNPGAGELRHPRAFLPLLRRAAIILVNREEANRLAQTRGFTVPEVLPRLRKLLSKNVVVVTDEQNGAWAIAGGVISHSATHRSLRVVERTGAGDAFGSGFLAGLLLCGGDVPSALQVATANAEGVMQRIGAKNGILSHLPNRAQRVRVVQMTLRS